MRCIQVTLFVSDRSKSIQSELQRLLPRGCTLNVINVDTAKEPTAHIWITPTVVVVTGSHRQVFYGFDRQRVRTMIEQAVKQSDGGRWSEPLGASRDILRRPASRKRHVS
jgi:hypothetical protein